jgi:branched-chain amino acid transport system ATP-binding protein
MSLLLEVDEIHTFYGDSHILQGVSFGIEAGRVVGLLGRNGVGKTTTLQSILGLPAPRSGGIRLRGEEIAGWPTYAIVRAGVGWVPQGHRIFPTLTTAENLALAAVHARPGPWTVPRIFELFPRLDERRNARGGTLSGGEQQMLAIARALVQNPELILMDEPTEGLSPKIVEEVGHVIGRLNQEGCAIFLVEQNLAFALRVTSSILVMNKGRIVFAGDPKQLSADDELCRQYVGVTASGRIGAIARGAPRPPSNGGRTLE